MLFELLSLGNHSNSQAVLRTVLRLLVNVISYVQEELNLTFMTMSGFGRKIIHLSPPSSKHFTLLCCNPPIQDGSQLISTLVCQYNPYSSLNSSIWPQYILRPFAT